MIGYYRDQLFGSRLKRCYDLATPRIRHYLVAEMEYVTRHIAPGDSVLELGCGYGRVLQYLSASAGATFGVDISLSNIEYAVRFLQGYGDFHLSVMNATRMGFADNSFEHVVCIQNGISAFHVDERELVCESVRVAKENGRIFFSSYSPKIWSDRLQWFELQAREGLIGEIDRDKTRDGVIVCKDGFTATTVVPEQFRAIVRDMPVGIHIEEVDESSLFFVLTPQNKSQ